MKKLTTNPPIVIGVIVTFMVINLIIIKKMHVPQEDMETYSVGNRAFGWLMVCFAYVGAFYVGSTYTGFSGTAFDIGLFAQYLCIYSIGGLCAMYLMARPVWVWGKHYQLETQADLIEQRYGNKTFKLFYSAFIIIVGGTWLIVELVTLGYILNVATNAVLGFKTGIVLIGIVVVIYTAIGGARASTVGSLVQGLTFCVLGTLVFYFLIRKAYGGLIPLYDMLAQHKPEAMVIGEGSRFLWMSSIITGVLGSFCWPNVFRGLYMAKSPREVKKAVFVAPVAALIVAFFILTTAMGGRLLPGAPEDGQMGLFWIANEYGGPFILGLVALFAGAAAISTISSVSNGISIIFAKDFAVFVNKDPKFILKSAKIATAIFGGIAILFAIQDLPQLMFMALMMYDCIVQCFIPLFGGMYWKRGNLQGTILGMLVGASIAVIGTFFPSLFSWCAVSVGILGLCVNLLIYIACGFIFKQQAHVKDMFEVLDHYDDNGVYWEEGRNA